MSSDTDKTWWRGVVLLKITKLDTKMGYSRYTPIDDTSTAGTKNGIQGFSLGKKYAWISELINGTTTEEKKKGQWRKTGIPNSGLLCG